MYSPRKLLTLVKCQGSQKIFGGFSSIGYYRWRWDSEDSDRCFIFSIEKSDDIQNMKLSRVKPSERALYDNDHQGFNFGNALYMEGQNLYVNNRRGSYEDNINDNNIYIIEEIEVFSVNRYASLCLQC